MFAYREKKEHNSTKESTAFFIGLDFERPKYLRKSTYCKLTTSWHINRNGTGASPANFTSGDIFVVQTGDSLTTTANWIISGTNSKLQIETAATLRGSNKITVPVFQIDGTGTYIHNVNNNAFPGTTNSMGQTALLQIREARSPVLT